MKSGTLDDAAFHDLVVKIARLLDGVTMNQADHALKTVGALCGATHRINTNSPEFLAVVERERRAMMRAMEVPAGPPN